MLNGDDRTVLVRANTLLVNVLRERLDLTGTKKGCELGNCGSCTVLFDGKPVNSCLVLAVEADGHEITTIEGVAQSDELDRLQDSFVENAAIQCGYCTPGMILSAKALLTRNPIRQNMKSGRPLPAISAGVPVTSTLSRLCWPRRKIRKKK